MQKHGNMYFVSFSDTKRVQILSSWKKDPPDSKVRGANMGPTWVLSAPDVPHVGPMNLAIWAVYPTESMSYFSENALWKKSIACSSMYQIIECHHCVIWPMTEEINVVDLPTPLGCICRTIFIRLIAAESAWWILMAWWEIRTRTPAANLMKWIGQHV